LYGSTEDRFGKQPKVAQFHEDFSAAETDEKRRLGISDFSVRGYGNQPLGWTRPWPALGDCTAVHPAANARVPTKKLQSAAAPWDTAHTLPKAA